MLPRILARAKEWVKAHKQFGLEFGERGFHTLVFPRTWRKEDVYRVAVGVIDRYYGNTSCELVNLGQPIWAIGNAASLVPLFGGSHTLVECYNEFFGSEYTKKLLDCPTFDVRLLKRCFKKTASTVFGTLDFFSADRIHRYSSKGC